MTQMVPTVAPTVEMNKIHKSTFNGYLAWLHVTKYKILHSCMCKTRELWGYNLNLIFTLPITWYVQVPDKTHCITSKIWTWGRLCHYGQNVMFTIRGHIYTNKCREHYYSQTLWKNALSFSFHLFIHFTQIIFCSCYYLSNCVRLSLLVQLTRTWALNAEQTCSTEWRICFMYKTTLTNLCFTDVTVIILWEWIQL